MKQEIVTMNFDQLLRISIKAAIDAGKEIMYYYDLPLEINYKSDDSPLTIADRSAHSIIASALKPTGIPLLSEEGKHNPFDERKLWRRLWIVDPLDGTKEFIRHNGEFTVNIGLVEDDQPVMGVVFNPPQRLLYFGSVHLQRSFKFSLKDYRTNLSEIFEKATPIPLKQNRREFTVVASKSHLNQETTDFIHQLVKKHGKINTTSIGSSLKFCLLAENSADIYPRIAPTYEWDTAAAHAILQMAGGEVISSDDLAPLRYNKENLLNPGFIARRPEIG